MFIFLILFLSQSVRRFMVPLNIGNGEPEMEKNSTSVVLPGFYEVFPEMKFKWPKWLKDKNGKRKPCKTDNDCPFPTTCCSHPILFGEDKFCCSGWGRRELVPSYVKNYIQDW